MAKKKRPAVPLPVLPALRPRNPFALAPQMHRGGAHDKSTGAKRRAERMDLQRMRTEGED